jgi:hypothetical protein
VAHRKTAMSYDELGCESFPKIPERTSMGTKREGVEAASLSQLVESVQIGVDEVGVVCIRRVMLQVPPARPLSTYNVRFTAAFED